tara:strand:+ start:4803 stop:5225 length:423 start_codon:yes stop_codon:yes gene_type:complete
MDLELLEKALENDDNINIIDTNIQEIKKKKNDILQQLNLNKDDLKSYHKKLLNYIYIDEIKDLKYGNHIRWINLKNIENIRITNGAILCDIKIIDKGISLVLRTYTNSFITLLLNEHLLFQRINDQEKILLKAIEYLNKK